ncbi:RsmB/NOP family class I SAM-dependent RNA methyltransferase, partial [Roseivivax isoporae]
EAALAAEDIAVRRNPRAATALTVTANARRVAQSAAYRDGLVELQDAGSQAVIEALPLAPGARVLDYCAGGGGKTLALAARLGGGPVAAHDAHPRRMSDLPARAARAGARVAVTDAPRGPYDLVLADVPCSGSGAWRRAPDGKWRLLPDDLDRLRATQAAILDTVAPMVAPGGHLAYVTCSVLPEENAGQVDAFAARHPGWEVTGGSAVLPDADGDGFYAAHLTRVR